MTGETPEIRSDKRNQEKTDRQSQTVTDSPKVADSHRQSQTVTDSHRQSQTVTDSHRQSQTVTDSHRQCPFKNVFFMDAFPYP